MLAKRIIPCLDVRNGRVVKGVKFVNIRDAGDPVECARRYDAEGADELGMTIAILGQGASKDEAIAISTAGEYKRVPVEKTMPVYITYFTMGLDISGTLRTFNDLYSRDAPVLAALDAPRVANRARTSTEKVVKIVDDLQND